MKAPAYRRRSARSCSSRSIGANHAADALVKGTGIGLSVVREYAQMHGGKVEVIETERGAHIRVTLPISARVQSPTPVLSGLTAAQAVK